MRESPFQEGPGTDARPPVRWGLGDVAIGLIPIYLGALALLAGGTDDSSEITVGALLVGSLFYWAFFVGVPLLATTRKGNGPVEDLGLRARPLDLPVGFGLGVFAQLVLVPLVYLPIVWLLNDVDVGAEAKDLTENATGAGILVLVLVVAIGAPIAEEIFFRGFMLRALERRMHPRMALVISSLAFGLSHLQGIQLPALVMLGLVQGYLVQRTDRLGLAIACHVGFNAVTLFALLVLHW